MVKWGQIYGCHELFLKFTLKITSNVHEINLHLRFNWDLNLIDICAAQSCSEMIRGLLLPEGNSMEKMVVAL